MEQLQYADDTVLMGEEKEYQYIVDEFGRVCVIG